MSLRTRALGQTGIQVSELGFGGWAIGGNEKGNSLGPTDDRTSRAAIDAALEAGVTFFDTADVYGHGKSESLLGEALAAAGRRATAVIATKAGADFTDSAGVRKHYEPEYLRTALRRSLERLRTDKVELFQIHDPPVEAIADPAVHAALYKLKAEGLARAVGASIHTLAEGLAAIEAGVYDTIQVALNVAQQGVASRLIARARAKGIGIIAREPLAQGFLTGKYLADHAFPAGDARAGFSAAHKTYVADLARRMGDYFHRRRKLERPLAAIAIQFVLADEGVATVIASMKTPEQVAENVKATGYPALAREELAWLRE